MTPNERINEISEISGISVEGVKMVLKAEIISTARSLAKGENAVLLGRVIFKPRVTPAGEPKISAVASTSLQREFEEALEKLREEKTEKKVNIPQLRYIEVEQLDGLL